MLTLRRHLRVPTPLITGLAHELGPMPSVIVLAREDVEVIDGLRVEVVQLAHLAEVQPLHVAHRVFVLWFLLLLFT